MDRNRRKVRLVEDSTDVTRFENKQITNEVQTRTHEAYGDSRPTYVQTSAADLLRSSLRQAGSAIGTYENRKYSIEQREKQKQEVKDRKKAATAGAAAAVKGEERAQDREDAYYTAYDQISGETVASRIYKKKVEEFRQNNPTMSTEELQAGITDIKSELLNDKNDDYIVGFHQVAEIVDNSIYTTHRREQQARHENTVLDGITETVATLGKAIGDDPLSAEDPGRTAGVMRKKLSDMQQKAKDSGIPDAKNKVTAAWINVLGPLAKQMGRPDLLKVFYTPDEDGGVQVIKSQYAGEIKRWEKAAETAQKDQDEMGLWSTVRSDHSINGTLNYRDALADLQNPEYLKKNNISLDQSRTFTSMIEGEWRTKHTMQQKQKDQYETNAMNEVFSLALDDYDGAVTLAREKFEGKTAYDVINVLNRNKSDGLAFNNVIKGIQNGTYTSQAEAMRASGLSGEDSMRVGRYYDMYHGENKAVFHKGTTMLLKQLEQQHSMLNIADAGPLLEHMNEANFALLEAVEARQKEGLPVRDLFNPKHKDYIIDDLVEEYKVTREQATDAMLDAQMSSLTPEEKKEQAEALRYQVSGYLGKQNGFHVYINEDAFIREVLREQGIDMTADAVELFKADPENMKELAKQRNEQNVIIRF